MKNKENYGKRVIYVQICTIILMALFSILFFADGINVIETKLLGYDEAYNASVAANIYRYGEYRVSYPNNIVFYNMITTGETVILPTALLYILFGINNITSTVVALLYALFSIWCVWILLYKVLKQVSNIKWLSAVAFVMTMGVILTDAYFDYVACHLIGESACIFFLLLCFLFLNFFFQQKRNQLLIFSGGMLAWAFLTKSSMIFFVVSIFGMMIIETFVTKRIKIKDLSSFFAGFFIGFAILDLYKLIQLGSLTEYINWWKLEWGNMLNQSSGIDITYSIGDKFQYLQNIFGYNQWICIVFILLPVGMYLLYLWNRIRKRKLCSDERLVMLMLGTSGASLLIYFLVLGGSGLVNARRHSVNAFFVKIFFVYSVVCLFIFLRDKSRHIRKRKMVLYVAMFVLGSLTILQPQKVCRSVSDYINKENQYSYEVRLMDEFLKEIDDIPDKATLYCAGWWQEPDITLFLDREMKDIYDVINGSSVLEDDSYFIVGNLINDIKMEDIQNNINASLVRVDTTEVDYNLFNSGFNREDFDNYAIYKIIKNPPKYYELDAEVMFSKDNSGGFDYVVNGLSTPENGFSWTDGEYVEWSFSVDPEVSSLECSIFVDGIIGDVQPVSIIVNDEEILSMEIGGRDVITFRFENNEEGYINLKLHIKNPICPADISGSDDLRNLGLQISKLIISKDE